jgi:hypothetical protein
MESWNEWIAKDWRFIVGAIVLAVLPLVVIMIAFLMR